MTAANRISLTRTCNVKVLSVRWGEIVYVWCWGSRPRCTDDGPWALDKQYWSFLRELRDYAMPLGTSFSSSHYHQSLNLCLGGIIGQVYISDDFCSGSAT